MISRDRKVVDMLSYDVKVGYSCNNRCKHCVIDDSKDKLIAQKEKIDLSTDECLSLIKNAAKNNADGVVLTGGEVSIRKDFDVLLNECLKNNLAITVQTNGRRFATDSMIRLIKPIKNIRFIIALHGSNASTHDAINQIKGSFAETCSAIQKLRQINKFVVIKVVISKINMKELPDLVSLVAKLRAQYICFAFPHGQGAARKNFEEVIPRYNDLKPIFESLIQIAHNNKINVEFETVPFCIIPKHMKLVGELKYLKGSAMFTQVREDTKDWNDVRHSIKKKPGTCQSCAMNSICEGPWNEYIHTFGGNEFKPIILGNDQKRLLKKAIEIFMKE